MATATTPKPAPTLEATIKAAVKVWVRTEQSAIWNLIKAVHKGLEGVYGPDRDTRAGALKTWINQAFEEEYGPGAAKDRAAHVSKIFKIALNAKPKDFDRWQKAGTGFYKAYEEFAVPQASPAKDKKKPEVVTVTEGGTTGTVTIEAGAGVKDVDADVAAASVKTAQEIADAAKVGKTVTPGPTVVGAPVITDTSIGEMTQYWADRIDENKMMWTKLLENLTDPKHMILTPDMVREAVVQISKKPALLRSTVALLMLNEGIAEVVLNHIAEHLTPAK